MTKVIGGNLTAKRQTKVVDFEKFSLVKVVGNARTNKSHVGLHCVVKTAVGTGGWHWCRVTSPGELNNQLIRVQRNALSFIRGPTGNEQETENDILEEEQDLAQMSKRRIQKNEGKSLNTGERTVTTRDRQIAQNVSHNKRRKTGGTILSSSQVEDTCMFDDSYNGNSPGSRKSSKRSMITSTACSSVLEKQRPFVFKAKLQTGIEHENSTATISENSLDFDDRKNAAHVLLCLYRDNTATNFGTSYTNNSTMTEDKKQPFVHSSPNSSMTYSPRGSTTRNSNDSHVLKHLSFLHKEVLHAASLKLKAEEACSSQNFPSHWCSHLQ